MRGIPRAFTGHGRAVAVDVDVGNPPNDVGVGFTVTALSHD